MAAVSVTQRRSKNGANQKQIDTLRSLGVSVASISSNELYTALQTHLIDGQENSYSIIESYRLYEVQKYLSVTNSSWGGSWQGIRRRRTRLARLCESRLPLDRR